MLSQKMCLCYGHDDVSDHWNNFNRTLDYPYSITLLFTPVPTIVALADKAGIILFYSSVPGHNCFILKITTIRRQ